MSKYARVAFLPDTFFEVNGVAHTARHLEAFARRREIPLLSVHCGPKTERMSDGAVSILQLKRSAARIALDANLDYDLLLMRYARRVLSEVREFGAELIHITGPGDLGAVGAYVSWALNIPLVISWHTSLHEYAGARLGRLLSFAGKRRSKQAGDWPKTSAPDSAAGSTGRAVVTIGAESGTDRLNPFSDRTPGVSDAPRRRYRNFSNQTSPTFQRDPSASAMWAV